MELAERMRQQNHEQFQTLVRMHLSFELDLHTDDNDVAPIGGDGKGAKFRKRFQFNKKPKAPPAAKSGAGGPMLSQECIGHMRKLMEFLMKEQNVIQEGIFRRTGSLARQTELKQRVVNDSGNASPLRLDSGTYTVHDCASVLKGVLADLPEPLLTDTYAPAHQQMAELCNSLPTAAVGHPTVSPLAVASTATTETNSTTTTTTAHAKATRLLHSLQLLILLLPAENRQLLQEIIEMLHRTMRHECHNKMSADSLATLFTPHLICPKKLTPEALHATAANLSGIISFMITRGAAIFECPPKLATDIRAYFVEQRRKQTLSPEQILDESVTSDSTANTVYTFVDRERTAQAHDQNPTDTCLAQLYAYIQSLPESSKKRKLINKFNKENGQGTPLQVQKLHRLKSGSENGGSVSSASKGQGKSLSDSIKRHIFQKNLLARTPKPSAMATGVTFATPGPTASVRSKTDGFDTPTMRSAQQQLSAASTPAHPLKTRVLFQSPASTPARPTVAAKLGAAQTPSASVTISNTKETSTPESAENSHGSSTISSADDTESSEFELLSETITQLQQKAAETCHKSVAFGPELDAVDSPTHDNDDGDDDRPQHRDKLAAMKARYTSEPNLTHILAERNQKTGTPASTTTVLTVTTTTTVVHPPFGNRRQSGGRYIANKLLKGVSMVNLMLPTTTQTVTSMVTTTTKTASPTSAASTPPLRKAASSMLSRSAERHPSVCNGSDERSPDVHDADLALDDEDIDDPDFVATPQSQRSGSNISRRFSADADFADMVTPTTRSTATGHASLFLLQQQQQSHPHLQHIIGRRSMSPITKSTQRMSKAMQESIMTPRSRKPVMLTGALLGGGCEQQRLSSNGSGPTNSFCSFREQDEDEHFDGADSAAVDGLTNGQSLSATPPMMLLGRRYTTGSPAFGTGNTLFKSKSEGDFSMLMLMGEHAVKTDDCEAATAVNAVDPESLTSPFKNYLFSRSVASPPSPVDSSFSSQPDDFGSTPDIHALTTAGLDTHLSDSLLFCLDGNQPASTANASESGVIGAETIGVTASFAPTLQRTASGSSRKRTNGGAEDGADAAEQQQYFDDLHPKKVTVTTTPSAAAAAAVTAVTAVADGDEPGETSL